MGNQTLKYHQNLAEYFNSKPLYLDEPTRKKPNTRKLVEQPWQQTKFAILKKNEDSWNLVLDTLCDLRFIEAKCAIWMIFELIDDYNNALNNLPENIDQINQEQQQRESIDRWTNEIIDYSKICTKRRTNSLISNIIKEPESHIPESPASCRIWSQEEIDSENKRITYFPTRLDQLNTFFDFVTKEFQTLNELTVYSDFIIQHALNYEVEGIVHNSAKLLLSQVKNSIMLRVWYEKDIFNSNPALIKSLEVSNHTVNCVDMTPNGRFIATGSGDSSIRLWDSIYGKCIREINPKAFSIDNISITPDCRLAITSTIDSNSNGILQLWDLVTGNCLQILKGHTSKILSICLTPDGSLAVSSSLDNIIRVWDMEKGTCVHVLGEPGDEICSVCITIDGLKAISAGGNYIMIWDIAKGQLLKKIEAGTRRTLLGTFDPVKFDKIKISPDGKTAVTSHNFKNNFMVWDLESGICLKEIGKRGGGAHSITPDVKYAMFTGYLSKTPFVVNLSSGEVVKIFEGHTQFVNGVCISPDNKFGISVSSDGTIKIWNIEKGNDSSIKQAKSHHIIRKILISNDNTKIFSLTDWEIKVWDLDTGQFLKQLEIASIKNGLGRSISYFNITPDNKHFITTFKFAENNICIWDNTGDVLLHELKGHTGEIFLIRISSDSNLIISASLIDRSIRGWDISAGICKWTIKLVNDHIKYGHLNISSDGKYFFYFSDSILKVINTKNGKEIGCYEVKSNYNDKFRDFGEILNNDKLGIRFSLLWLNRTYIIRNLNNSLVYCTLGSVKLTSDCRFAFTSDDHFLTMWNLDTVSCVCKFNNPNKREISYGGFSNPDFADFIITPDDQYVISRNNDFTVRIWEINSCKCIAVERINSLSSMAFSMTKQKIIIGTLTEELQIYNLSGVNFKSIKNEQINLSDNVQKSKNLHKWKFWKR